LSAKVAGVDLDLTQVRAFAAAANQLHFGRAAAQLFLTQQALSKRISRLERALGEQLFVRGTRAPGGGTQRRRAAFPPARPHARRLLAAADAAAFAAHPGSWPLRIDVWGQVQAPLRIVRRLLSTTPDLAIEPSMRRSLPAALKAIGRGEIDACFGRPHDLASPWPNGLSRRPVLLEPLAVAVGPDHPWPMPGHSRQPISPAHRSGSPPPAPPPNCMDGPADSPMTSVCRWMPAVTTSARNMPLTSSKTTRGGSSSSAPTGPSPTPASA
jgi:DNA-binding transcriptional LysR family regulator